MQKLSRFNPLTKIPAFAISWNPPLISVKIPQGACGRGPLNAFSLLE
jgi:hypothetical protein